MNVDVVYQVRMCFLGKHTTKEERKDGNTMFHDMLLYMSKVIYILYQ